MLAERPDELNTKRMRQEQEGTADQELIVRLRSGDVSAFDTIVLLYNDALEEYAWRITHDTDLTRDIVQDVFVRLWDIRASLEIRGTLQSYLYGSVRNRAISMLRHAQVEEQCVLDFLHDSATPWQGERILPPDIALERQELAVKMTEALATLSPRVRQVALLRWRDKLSRPEIAAILGVSVPTVNNQLTTAARILRPLLMDQRSEKRE